MDRGGNLQVKIYIKSTNRQLYCSIICQLYVADTPSRAPVTPKSDVDDAENIEGATETFITAVVSQLPVISTRLEQLCKAQSEDKA